jgi:peptidoglycan/xylan/chitin deacetylase (PgdA/CDA1 family)
LYTVLIALILSICVPAAVAAPLNELIFVAKNDELLSFPEAKPEVRKDITYVPIRFFADSLQAQVEWTPFDGLVTVAKGRRYLQLDVAKKLARTDELQTKPVELFMKNDRTMVPYRFIAEHFGYHVSYIAAGPIARVTDETAQLTDEELYKKYAGQINAEKARVAEEERLRQEEEKRRAEEEKKNQQPKTDKEVYLTFDDGPNGYTPQILDILQNNQILGTFFMLKGQMESFPGNVKRMKSDGHGLALHGVTHDANKIYRSPQTVVDEMEACNTTLEKLTGVRTALMRVPYGSKPYMTKSYRDAVVNAGYHMWDWNIDSTDSKAAVVPANTIVSEVIRQLQGKKKAVILFHDKKTTVEALPRIVEYLKKNDYAFKRLENGMTPMNFWGDER